MKKHTGYASFHIKTFGCQMNEHDSERMAGLLAAEGLIWTDNPEQADFVLINSCSIRLKAEEKAFSIAGRLRDLKKSRPQFKLGFCGCVAQRERELIFKRAPYIDLVLGTLNISHLPELAKRSLRGEERVCEVLDDPVTEGVDPCLALRENPIRSWITIMEGCNNFCSYCVVPYVRGRERSRSPESIINEVNYLVNRGCREITLLGQNVNSYGNGISPHIDFAGLLYLLDKIPDLERIRFTTNHPKDLSPALIEAIKECTKVCEHIHMPLQSGSDAVLKRMGRGYTLEEYMSKMRALRDAVPGISLTGDIICGFPGETEGDFEKTLDVIREIRFDGLFSFNYSARPQTRASVMPDQIPLETRLVRLSHLQRVQNQICSEINAAMEGRTEQVLIEGPSKKDPFKFSGRTRTNKVVNIPPISGVIGKTVAVHIKKARRFDLEGEINLIFKK